MDPKITLTVAVLEFIFCLIGIAAQILVCSTIIRYRKTTFSNTFYTLVVALAIPDTLHLCSEIFCALPAVFLGLENTPKWYMYTWGYLAVASFFALTPLMFVIAINRYVAVCHFDAYKRLFTHFRIKIIISFCFIFWFFIPSVMYGCKCYFAFTSFTWLFHYEPDGCADFALNLNAVVANSICGGVIIVYVLIAIQYRRIQKKVGASLNQSEDDRKRRAKETKLMIQFAVICAVLVGYQTFFWIFLKAWTNEPSEMVLNFLVNLNSCISPFLYLTFGSEIRSRLPWKKPNNIEPARTMTKSHVTVKVKSVPVEING